MPIDTTKSINACAAHYGENEEAMRQYLIDGEKRAAEFGNRGLLRFDANGELDTEIQAAYAQHGFYIFEGVIQEQELAELKQDISEMRARFALTPEGQFDKNGDPALGTDRNSPAVQWVKPLSDPLGGTALYNGRHQVKLFEPTATSDAPEFAPLVVSGHLQYSQACLRLYGHPQLLKVAETVHGEDFAPFNETLFLKDPGLGAAVSWHQDGDTHWDNPNFDGDIHGFNFMAQLYHSTAVNGLWVVPGTHKLGKIDVKSKMEEAGSERLPDAIPMICEPGDVIICNRQLVHGSFANTGFEPRLTVNFGFHRRSSVLNVQGAGMHSEAVVYDAEHIRKRSEPIGLAIAARADHFSDEEVYSYKPLKGELPEWSSQAFDQLKNYNLLDLSI